ncbi:MAG: histidine phosphatase family protein [Deltaproteobacteria bacterium]|jgi:probable phosphoglycerate mutase|nr:histidine phosphatase family protein [Deltaproteobacteria bacterium]
MELYLLRHGLSVANERGLVTGTKEDPLTEAGRRQAVQAALTLQSFGPEKAGSAWRCYVSDWRRARESAVLALPEREFSEFSEFFIDARLGETDAGTAAALPLEEFQQKYPDFWGRFDPEHAYPGGESHQQLFTRALSWLSSVEAALPDEARVLAVTHAGPICCLLHHVCGVSMARFPAFLATHSSLTKVARGAGGVWRLVFFSLPPGARV